MSEDALDQVAQPDGIKIAPDDEDLAVADDLVEARVRLL